MSMFERFKSHPWRWLIVAIALLATGWWAGHGRGYRMAIVHLFRPPPVHRVRPEIAAMRPADLAGNVRVDVTITAQVKSAAAIDAKSVNGESVHLVRTWDQSRIPAVISSQAGERKILIQPERPLDASTDYTLYVTSEVRDALGTRMIPFAGGFTTTGLADASIRFQQIPLPTARGAGFTSLVIGPDHKLYAGVDDGRIFRFKIQPDGTLDSPEVIKSLQHASGPRLLTGFCFDPRSTADNLIIYASNGYPGFTNVPDWSGRITRMSGADLEDVQDLIDGLPRSVRDHLTFQPVIGPDGAIYFGQGSNSASGAPDSVWGNRPERTLSAAVLRLDVSKLPAKLPLDVRTRDGGGTYDPGAANTPLTIYASGVRVAYDLVWTRYGQLLAPTNGSSAGGNTPGDGAAKGLTNVALAEDDWLFNIEKGKYYGHPNPFQNHFILNGGNPTRGFDFAETPDYPVATQPDRDWQRAIFSFGKHVSADGAIEYAGDAFGGKLDGWLIVCRYNVGADLIALHVSRAGKVDGIRQGIEGFTRLQNPLDLCENKATGAIYVSEYGAQKIRLLRPVSSPYVALPE